MPAHPVARDKIDAYGLERILDDILEGRSLQKIVETIQVDKASLFRWTNDPEHPERAQKMRDYREMASYSTFEMALHVFEDPDNPITDMVTLGIAREKAQHYRKMAAVQAPKVFGDKQHHEHSGKDGNPIEIGKMTDDQVDARITQILARSGSSGTSGTSGTPAGS